jgi:hypothetical protein
MSDAQNRATLLEFLSAHSDECLSDTDREKLVGMLRESREARLVLIEHAFLESMLANEARGESFARQMLARSGYDAETSGALSRDRASESRPLGRSTRADGPSPTASVLGFLHRAMRIGGETPLAAALMWMVMAILLSGTLLTVVFIAMMVFAPKVGQQVMVKNGEPTKAATSGMHVPSATHRAADTSTVARLIRTVDCQWETGAPKPKTGDDFAPGSKFTLRSGLAEIMFQSGARAVLQGPATLEIRSRMAAYLQHGKVAIAVEDSLVKGFEVRTPGMKYTDLGTEFGVYVAANGEQEMQVFRGTVQAEEVTDENSGTGNAEPAPKGVESSQGNDGSQPPSQSSHKPPAVFSANQGVHVAPPDPSGKKPRQVERIAADDKKFTRSLTGALPVFSTGVDLDRGASDPHWEITAISTDPTFKPRQAVVIERLRESYMKDSRDKAQWIADEKLPATMPAGCRWTLRTRFDLAGFDPASAKIDGLITADNIVAEVRINGKSIQLPKVPESKWFYRKTPILIDRDFVSGVNTIEVVIENSNPAAAYDPMALCLELHGTATKSAKSGE